MKTGKLIFSIIVCVCSIQSVNAQFLSTTQGTYGTAKKLTQTDYTDVIGSAFLSDNWLPGTAKTANGESFKGDLKYDLVKDELLFKGDKDEPYTFVDPIAEFVITDDQGQHHFKNGYPSVDVLTSKSFFEVLADGSATLLKKDKKDITESTPYNSATPERKFNDNIKYYIVVKGKIAQVKKDEKSFLAAIGNKQTELDTYYKTNKLNLKNDADMVKLIMYYNSL